MSTEYKCDGCGVTSERKTYTAKTPKGWGAISIVATHPVGGTYKHCVNSSIKIDLCGDCFDTRFPIKEDEEFNMRDPLLDSLREFVSEVVYDEMDANRGDY